MHEADQVNVMTIYGYSKNSMLKGHNGTGVTDAKSEQLCYNCLNIFYLLMTSNNKFSEVKTHRGY